MNMVMNKKKVRDYKQISFRLSDEELVKAQKMAKDAGLTVAKLAKRSLLRQKVKSPVIAREVGLEIDKQLARIGSNVNQIAKKVNAGEPVRDLELIRAQINALWDYVLTGKKQNRR